MGRCLMCGYRLGAGSSKALERWGQELVSAVDSDRTDKAHPALVSRRFFLSLPDLCRPSLASPKHLPRLGMTRRDGAMGGQNRRLPLCSHSSLQPSSVLLMQQAP